MPTDTTTPPGPLRERLLALVAADGRPVSTIARAAGVSQQGLDAFISGSRGRRPSAELVARLARELGLSPTALGRLVYDEYPAEKNPSNYPECG